MPLHTITCLPAFTGGDTRGFVVSILVGVR